MSKKYEKGGNVECIKIILLFSFLLVYSFSTSPTTQPKNRKGRRQKDVHKFFPAFYHHQQEKQ